MDLDHLMMMLGDTGEVTAPDTVQSYRDIWVIGQVANGDLTACTAQLLGKARELASDLGAYVRAGLFGHDLGDLGKQLIALGADVAHVADCPDLADLSLELPLHVLGTLLEEFKPAVILMPSGVIGDQLAPRLAQRFNATLTTQVVALRPDLSSRAVMADYAVYNGEFYESRSILAGPTFGPDSATQMFSVLPGAFRTPDPDRYRTGTVEPVAVDPSAVTGRVGVVGPTPYQRPLVAISRAQRIVALGFDLGEENVSAARALAERWGAHLAGDRTAASAGWIDYNQVVGVTGYDVAPDVYLALGVRGNTEHNVGMERARFVIAIHPDPNASIFEVADWCIVAEPGQILARL
jgi:electron transfer flavoprotein alpha subunit